MGDMVRREKIIGRVAADHATAVCRSVCESRSVSNFMTECLSNLSIGRRKGSVDDKASLVTSQRRRGSDLLGTQEGPKCIGPDQSWAFNRLVKVPTDVGMRPAGALVGVIHVGLIVESYHCIPKGPAVGQRPRRHSAIVHIRVVSATAGIACASSEIICLCTFGWCGNGSQDENSQHRQPSRVNRS